MPEVGFWSGLRSALAAAHRPRSHVAAREASAPESTPIPRPHRSRRSHRNEAVSAIPPNVVAMFQHAASTGDTSRQTQFYKDARILDSRLDAVCATRVLAVQGRPIIFKPPAGYEHDKEAREIATRVSRLWGSTRRTIDAVGHLAHAPIEGHAGLAQRWVVDPATGWYRTEFEIEKSSSPLFVFDPDTAEPWFNARLGQRPSKPDDLAFPLSERPDQFVFFSPTAGRADDPWRRGAIRARIIGSLLKRTNVGHWTALLERWGQPQVGAEVDYDTLRTQRPDDSDESIEDEIINALRAIGRDWRATFPKGVTLKEIPVSVADGLHKNYIDWANTEDAIAILGQNLSTEVTGGSFAAASAHNRIRIDILTSDCVALAEALTDQWVEPIVRRNWPGAPVPYAELVVAPRTEFTLDDVKANVCSVDEYRTGKGHEGEPDGRGARYLSNIVTTPTGTEPSASAEPAKPSDTGEPGANTVDATPPGSAPTAAPEAVGEVQVAEVDKAADAALNGAQVASLMAIVERVAAGAIPRETGIELITSAFPIDAAKAEKIMGTVGAGFVPTPTE